MNASFALLGLFGIATPVFAQSISAGYSNHPATVDSGGSRATSSHYSHEGSVGLISGVSTAAAPSEIAKHGYIGQLFDIVGFALDATPTTLNEAGTRQLRAGRLLDDATILGLPAASVTWSIADGPLIGIDANGIATAGVVYQSAPATAQATFEGNTSTLALTVLNVDRDNFGAYAGDTLDDGWQVQYFGLPPNANAGPLADFDRDGHTNVFEHTAGLIPTDADSVFRLRLEAVPGQPAQKRVIFSPRFTDRAYTVKAKSSLLSGSFTPLGSSTISDNAEERTVTDLNAVGATKFYEVEITKP